MLALLTDLSILGVPALMGWAVYKALQGRYKGKRDPQPDDGITPPKDK